MLPGIKSGLLKMWYMGSQKPMTSLLNSTSANERQELKCIVFIKWAVHADTVAFGRKGESFTLSVMSHPNEDNMLQSWLE